MKKTIRKAESLGRVHTQVILKARETTQKYCVYQC